MYVARDFSRINNGIKTSAFDDRIVRDDEVGLGGGLDDPLGEAEDDEKGDDYGEGHNGERCKLLTTFDATGD